MIATLGTGIEARPKHTCPLCGYNSTLGQDNPSDSTSSTPQKSEMDQLSELAKHIAGHLRCLAFHTLDHLDSDQESVSEQEPNTTSVKARGGSRPPGELKDSDDVSSGFGTNSDPRSISNFDEIRSSRKEGRPVGEASPQIVSIPPKFEEHWQSIRETNPTEEDTVMHHMMIYTLWDRAYDDLKKMNPLLVERYEMLLSEELSVDPEGESKQIFNVFCGPDIHKRRTLLNTIADNLLEQMRHTLQSNQVPEPVMQAGEWLSTSAMGFPKATLPRVGLFLALRFLANVETTGGGDWRGFIILMSRMPWHSVLEFHLRSLKWTSSEVRVKELIQLEKSVLQLCQKMLELQIRAVVPDDQLDDLEELLSEAKSLDREVMDQASAAGINIDLAPIQPGRQWTAATLLELVTALGPVQENVRRLNELFEIDPRNVKRSIEKLSDWLFSDRLSRVLDHPSFLQFQNGPHTRLFCIRGRLATGKTTLLCSMIDHLSAKLTVVPYFFCQITNPNLNNGTAVLRGLLYLLARARPSLISKYNLLQKQREGNISAWEPISEIFATLLTDPTLQGTVLVVDALDECVADRDLLMEFIKRPSFIKWIVSSRNMPDIIEGLGDANKVTLELERCHLGGGAWFDGKVDELSSQ
ncbi:NACHT domain-containing protein [Fusarium sp. LHS14.1]|nr:NACHT domain-containing protein [Fusarium sp. LHS14.1]